MTTKERQEALFREHVNPRTDGRLDFTLDDHLRAIAIAERLGVDVREHAKALGVFVDYLRSLKATMIKG